MIEHPAPPDAIFADARLAPLYDVFDPDRRDLPAYLALAREFEARTLLDVGCGTGTLALLAADAGLAVTAVDPARESLDVARAKPGADRVRWHCGDATTAPAGPYDLIVMTGNVAQVFTTDAAWLATLRACRGRLAAAGRLCYETRRPEARAWEGWARDPASACEEVPGVGEVRQRRELLTVALPLVSFRWTYTFPDGSEVASDSTLRFRDDAENRALLSDAGFAVLDVRESPDRPGLERVYIAAPAAPEGATG